MKYNTVCGLSVILFFICCFSALSAQVIPGYCILSSGDSLYGAVNIDESTSQYLYFKTLNAAKWRRYQAKEVKKTVLENGVVYLSYKVVFRSDTQEVFLHSLVSGEYTLFNTQTSSEGVLFFINSKQNTQLLKVNYRALETQLNAYFGECTKSFKGKLRYAENNLISFVEAMNQCKSPASASSRVYQKKVNMGLSLGGNLNFYRYTGAITSEGAYFTNLSYPPDFKPGGGLNAEFQLGKVLIVQSGLNYFSTRLQKNDTVSQYIPIISSDYLPITSWRIERYKSDQDFNLQYLEIPVGITFNFFQKLKTVPVIGAGYSLTIPVVTQIRDNWYEKMAFPALSSTPDEKFMFRHENKYFWGWYVSLGCRRRISTRNEVELNIRYHATGENNRLLAGVESDQYPIPLKIKTNRIQLGITYSWLKSVNK